MTDDTLDEKIDELAVQIEQSIAEAKAVNEEYDGVFDPKYRRMEEADVSAQNLFS